jgi:hypothetical protein
MYHADLKEIFLRFETPEMPTKWTRLWYLVQQLALVWLQDINVMFIVTAVVIGVQSVVCLTYCGSVCVVNWCAVWGLPYVLRQCVCC